MVNSHTASRTWRCDQSIAGEGHLEAEPEGSAGDDGDGLEAETETVREHEQRTRDGFADGRRPFLVFRQREGRDGRRCRLPC